MNYKTKIIYALLMILFITLFTSCANVQVDLSNPEIVVQKFMEAQAVDNRRVINALLTKELKAKFKEQKLFLYDREDIPKGSLLDSESILAWDEENKKVYQINYSVQYKLDGETKKLGLKEAVSLTQKDGNWYIDDYVPEKD